MIAAETITIKLVNILTDFEKQKNWSSEDSIVFSQEAKKLREANVGEGDMIFGIIYCFDNKIENMHKAFRNAIAHMPNNTFVLYNYALSLFKVGLYSESLARVLEVERRDKSPNTYLLLATLCATLGLYSKSKGYFALSGNNPSKFALFLSGIEKNQTVRHDTLAVLEKSFIEDASVWESLAKR